MARKSKSQKALNSNELIGIMSDTIRNVKNGTISVDEANSISQATRTICGIVKTQMQAYQFTKSNPEAKLGSNLLE